MMIDRMKNTAKKLWLPAVTVLVLGASIYGMVKATDSVTVVLTVGGQTKSVAVSKGGSAEVAYDTMTTSDNEYGYSLRAVQETQISGLTIKQADRELNATPIVVDSSETAVNKHKVPIVYEVFADANVSNGTHYLSVNYRISENKENSVLITDFGVGTFVNVTPTISSDGGYDGAPMFTIVGRPSYSDNPYNLSAGGYYKWSAYLRWDYELDFTDLKEISYYARQNALHGRSYLFVSDGLFNANNSSAAGCPSTISNPLPPLTVSYACGGGIGYSQFPNTTNWLKATLDTSNVTGVHILSILGGYSDGTGNAGSSISFSNIRLTYYN
ncbi:MAG: hypothetical protein LBK50_03090 [Candidatus Nomurabacteria bacterium]|nr:hypothetical protein [Candidatus Nomurabacteria bacterium]